MVVDQPVVSQTLFQDVHAVWDARYPMSVEYLASVKLPADVSKWVQDAHQVGLSLDYQAKNLNYEKISIFPKFNYKLIQSFNYNEMGKYLENLKKRNFKLKKKIIH